MVRTSKRKAGSSRAAAPSAAVSSATKAKATVFTALGDSASRQSARDARQKAFRADAGLAVRGFAARKRNGRKLASRLLGARPLSAAVPSGNFIVADGALIKTMQGRRAEGTKRLATRHTRGITLRMSGSLLAALDAAGVKPKPGSTLSAQQYRVVRTAIAASTAVVARRSALLEECRAKKAATAAFDATTGGAQGAVDAPAAADAVANTPSTQTIEQTLTSLVSSLADEATLIPSRADPADVTRSLDVDLSPGPADTTALYDFDTLHLAWQDTWTAVFDRLTADQIATLYAELTRVVEPADLDALMADEASDLDGLLAAVGGVVNELGGLAANAAPPEIAAWLPEAGSSWNALSTDQQDYIRFLFAIDQMRAALNLADVIGGGVRLKVQGNDIPSEWIEGLPSPIPEDWAITCARGVLQNAATTAESDLGRLRGLLEGLRKRICEPYQFDVFVPGSYNYGLVTTYRQAWRPLTYQVGDLVATVPLAPGETRTYSKKTVETSRSSQTINRASTSNSSSSSDQDVKTESEIVRKATQSGKFATNAHADGTLGLFSVGASAEASGEISSDSADTKRDIRSAVRKAAQDYRDERKIDVTTSRDYTRESSETGTISNPNNEITVTYLFYELQRRYEISERLHRIRPVVLVAFEVPAPHEIDEDWLLSFEWVLRPALLDASLGPVFDLLRDGFASLELETAVLKKQWDTQLSVVAAIRDNVAVHAEFKDAAREAFRQATEAVPDTPGLSTRLYSVLYGSGATEAVTGDIDTKTEVEARREASRLALDWAQADFNQAESRLQASVTSLRQATEAYTTALSKRLSCRTRIDQLRVHVKQNILFYMQAIWRTEPRDQRYMRLYDQMVEWPEAGDGRYRVVGAPAAPLPSLIPARHPNLGILTQGLQLQLPAPKLGDAVPLQQVADLDGLLGFRGNYAVFPLREGNAVTDFLAQGFLDTHFGIDDPDPAGEIPTPEEAVEIAKCAWIDPGATDEDKQAIVEWLTSVLGGQGAVAEEIVVPSGQLFIEALPGSHPLLEDFKLRHRAIDMQSAAQALRISKVETIRRLMRLAQGDLGAPDSDRRLALSGAGDVSVTVDSQG